MGRFEVDVAVGNADIPVGGRLEDFVAGYGGDAAADAAGPAVDGGDGDEIAAREVAVGAERDVEAGDEGDTAQVARTHR